MNDSLSGNETTLMTEVDALLNEPRNHHRWGYMEVLVHMNTQGAKTKASKQKRTNLLSQKAALWSRLPHCHFFLSSPRFHTTVLPAAALVMFSAVLVEHLSSEGSAQWEGGVLFLRREKEVLGRNLVFKVSQKERCNKFLFI